MALMEKRLLGDILGSVQFLTLCNFSIHWYVCNNKQKHAAMLHTSITSIQSWFEICYFNIKWELQHRCSFFSIEIIQDKIVYN